MESHTNRNEHMKIFQCILNVECFINETEIESCIKATSMCYSCSQFSQYSTNGYLS